MLYICNAFSINMLGQRERYELTFKLKTLADAQGLVRGCEYKSYVGHPDIAKIIAEQLGVDIPLNRETLEYKFGRILVAQYKGNRLPAGTTKLPENASIEYWLIS